MKTFRLIFKFSLIVLIASSCSSIKRTPKYHTCLKKLIWEVKNHNTPHGPGNNLWSKDQVAGDVTQIHLSIDSTEFGVQCSEIILEKDVSRKLGYGVYQVHTIGHLDSLEDNTVFGLFLYQKKKKNPVEIDIEYTKWAGKTQNNVHYSKHNFIKDKSVTIEKNINLKPNYHTHIIKWTPDSLSFGTFYGHQSYNSDMDKSLTLMKSEYGKKPKNMRFHINFWKLPNSLPRTEDQEIILKRFKYLPLEFIE